MLFFVKVRIDVDRLDELDRRLRDGSLDRSALQATYCYRDVGEITPVVAPDEALALLRG